MAIFIILSIFATGLALIATECVTKVNKAAVAMFLGVICWLFYIGYGTSFVISEHQIDFLSYLSAHGISETSVRDFIADNVFFRYVARAAGIVLFLLGTMTIVSVLNGNGCFDFIQEWLRTRSARRFAIILTGITFILSANLDNLTTVCLMLSIVHTMVADTRQRMMLGALVVVAAACGGAFTVIGDVTSLALWTHGLISPTAYAAQVVLPSVAALVTILLLMLKSMPRHLRLMQTAPPYRGDDTILTRTQRLIMLIVGIGGLWFIPTFHRITLLPPFLGALCVLSLLWIVHEICNARLLQSGQMTRTRQPMALQFLSMQHILFYIGITLALGAINETGIFDTLFEWSTSKVNNVYAISGIMGLLSAVFNNVTMLLCNIAVYTPDAVEAVPEIYAHYDNGGVFWPLLSYTTAVGSCLLCIGSMSGFALMRMEGASLRWYVRHVSGKVLAGFLVGLIVFYVTNQYL